MPKKTTTKKQTFTNVNSNFDKICNFYICSTGTGYRDFMHKHFFVITKLAFSHFYRRNNCSDDYSFHIEYERNSTCTYWAHNIDSKLIQRHDVESTLIQCSVHAVCLFGTVVIHCFKITFHS